MGVYPRHRIPRLLALGAALTLVGLAAVAEVPTDPPTFSDPLTFENEYFPFEVGAIRLLGGPEEGAIAVALDLFHPGTRLFPLDGGTVECRILEEVAFEDGEYVETSLNYFAEADDGTVYYFGEVVDNYEDGELVDHEGSWLVGGPTLPSDPAETATATEPAVFMPGDPEVGDVFKPEDLFPFVDETALVVHDDYTVYGSVDVYEGTLVIRETSQLSPGSEYKAYAPGIGVVAIQAVGTRLDLYGSTFFPEDEEEE
jgi:hypothetical protein